MTRPRPRRWPATRAITRDAAIGAAATALVGSFIGYFLFTGMPQFSLQVFPRTLQLHIVMGAATLLYIAYLAIARRLPGGTPLDLPVLGLASAYGVAAALSISWRVSLEPYLFLLATIAVFYLLSDAPLLSADTVRRAFMLAGFGLALYALWVVGDDYADYLRLVRRVEGLKASNIFPATVPRVHDVSDHPNILAMVLTLVMPFYAVAAIRPAAAWERVLGVVALPVSAMAIFLTLSRGGWLGAGVGVGFAVVAAWLTLQAHERERQGFPPSWANAIPRGVSPTALATLAGAAVLIGGGTLAFLSSASTRPGWLFRGSLSPREDAWESSLDMFADYPLVGSGPHTFGLLYPQYSGEFLVHTQHAHNGFLQVANDAGILGLLALLGVAIAVVYMLLTVWRDGELQKRMVVVACAAGLLGFCTHNLLDAGNTWKAPAIALAVVAAVIGRTYRAAREHAGAEGSARERTPAPRSRALTARLPEPMRRALPLVPRAALLIAVLVPLAGWARVDRAHHDYYLGAGAYNRGDDQAAIEDLQRAVDRDSSMMVYRLLLGQAQARAFDAGGRSDRALIDRAIVNTEQAARLDKRSDIARANLARVYALAGRSEDAAREARITRLAVHHVVPVLAAAEVYEMIDYDEDAVSTYGQVLSMDASLADSRYWEGTAWRQEHYDQIVAASVLGVNPCTYGAHLVQAHRSNASASLDELPAAEEGCKLLLISAPNDLTLRVALAKIQLERGQRDNALGHLRHAVDRQPDFGPARTELGRWHAAGGDIEAARHEWVVGAQLDEPESVMLLGNSYRPEDRPAALTGRLRDLLRESGSSVQNDSISLLYYRMRYARISPLTGIIPGDWQTAVPRIYAEMQETLARWESESEG